MAVISYAKKSLKNSSSFLANCTFLKPGLLMVNSAPQSSHAGLNAYTAPKTILLFHKYNLNYKQER